MSAYPRCGLDVQHASTACAAHCGPASAGSKQHNIGAKPNWAQQTSGGPGSPLSKLPSTQSSYGLLAPDCAAPVAYGGEPEGLEALGALARLPCSLLR